MQGPNALKQILEQRLPASLEMLREMVAINSYTENKEGVNRVGRYTAQCFAELGFQPEYVPSENPAWGDHLILTRRGRSPRTIAMISHLDTVFPPEEEVRNHFNWQTEGDWIYGPGTNDIKGGTMMMHLVLSGLRAFAPAVFEDFTWLLMWNASEETLSKHFGKVCLSRFDGNTEAALVFESEGRRNGVPLLVIARKGRATYRVKVSGRGAHAGSDHRRGANAIAQLARTIQRVEALTDYSNELTFNVGVITGGVAVNRVPHEAVADVEMRAFDPEVYAAGKAAILALNGPGDVASVDDGQACRVEIRVMEESAPWPRNPGTDRLLGIWQATAQELGRSLDGASRGGLSDGNLVWHAVPTIDGLGPYGEFGHCSERSADGSKVPEYIEVSSIIPKALLNILAIVRLA